MERKLARYIQILVELQKNRIFWHRLSSLGVAMDGVAALSPPLYCKHPKWTGGTRVGQITQACLLLTRSPVPKEGWFSLRLKFDELLRKVTLNSFPDMFNYQRNQQLNLGFAHSANNQTNSWMFHETLYHLKTKYFIFRLPPKWILNVDSSYNNDVALFKKLY